MKKLLILFIAAVLLLSLSGCLFRAEAQDMPGEITVPKGATIGDLGLPEQLTVKHWGKLSTVSVSWVGEFNGEKAGKYTLHAESAEKRLHESVDVIILPNYEIKEYSGQSVTIKASASPALPDVVSAIDSFGREIAVPVNSWNTENADLTVVGTYTAYPDPSADYKSIQRPEVVLNVLPSDVIAELSPAEEISAYDDGSFDEALLPVLTATDEFGNSFPLSDCKWQCDNFDSRVAGSYSFRLSAPEELSFTCELPELKVNIKPAPYVAPEGWYVPEFETRTISGGGYILTRNVMGIKVKLVQQMLGITFSELGKWGYYKDPTIDAVKKFQRKKGLPVTGDVDFSTWTAMNLSGTAWNEVGAYVTPVQVTPESTWQEYIDVFIRTAESYIGSDFVYGGAGTPKFGADCSGLVLQCMYAVGVYPDGIDPVQHATNEYNSTLMWADPKLVEVPMEELSPGDLVFYYRNGDETEEVIHVAIYYRDGQCIEAYGNFIQVLDMDKSEWYGINGIKRVIAHP